VKLETRSSFGWPATRASTAPCKNGLVVHYDGFDQNLVKKGHEACRGYWKATRKFHMGSSRGWLDIGYSFGVCPHGVVLEGRGWGRTQAAQPGGNTTWTSCTFMSGDHEQPTAAQLAAFKELRAWLRGKGLAAAVKGHQDFVSTSCPGTILYKKVKDGKLLGAPPAPAPPWPGRVLAQPPEMQGADVLAWQRQMVKVGKTLTVDGWYGPASEKVCRALQKSRGLVVDGEVGAKTWAASFSSSTA
jgi:hypothetical protein